MRSTIRRLPLPPTEPPFDDQRSAGAPAPSQGALALSFDLPTGVPAVPRPPHQLRLISDDSLAPPREAGDDGFADPQPTARSALPDPRRWTAHVTQAIAEILCAQRPPQQLLRWASPEIYDALLRRVRAVNRRPSAERMARLRPHVRALRVCEPADGVAEASAVIEQGGRYRALALRFEGLDGRWRCTVLEII